MKSIHKNQMAVAILTRVFPNIVQTYVLNHIISLKNTRINTIIISEHGPRHDEVHPNVYHFDLLRRTIYIKHTAKELLKHLFSTPITNTRNLTRIIFSNIWKKEGLKYGFRALTRALFLPIHEIDLIHSHSLFSSYNFLFLNVVFKIPLTTTFHGLVPNNVKMLEQRKISAVLTAGDAFFVNTEFAKNQLLGYGCQSEKIHKIPQGTNIDDFPYMERKINMDEPIIILSVGRLSIEKGFHIAINAIASIIDEYPNIDYRIVGNGLERDNLQKQIDGLALTNNVRLYGSLSTADLSNQYSVSHIFILPSIDLHDGYHVETQGVVLQEAQASGIPVIASHTGGIPEIIQDNTTGLLFEENNDNELSDKIKILIRDKNLYKSLSISGRTDVENNYRNEVISKKLVDVYKRILASNGEAI